MGLDSCSSRATRSHVPHPSRTFQALIKIYSLVDCPIYSVVKYRPLKQLSAVSLQRLAKDLQPRITSVPALAGLGLAESRQLKTDSFLSNPMFGVKRLSLNRDTESVVVFDAQHRASWWS